MGEEPEYCLQYFPHCGNCNLRVALSSCHRAGRCATYPAFLWSRHILECGTLPCQLTVGHTSSHRHTRRGSTNSVGVRGHRHESLTRPWALMKAASQQSCLLGAGRTLAAHCRQPFSLDEKSPHLEGSTVLHGQS